MKPDPDSVNPASTVPRHIAEANNKLQQPETQETRQRGGARKQKLTALPAFLAGVILGLLLLLLLPAQQTASTKKSLLPKIFNPEPEFPHTDQQPSFNSFVQIEQTSTMSSSEQT